MEYVTYGELSREEQIALFNAWLDDKDIEYLDSDETVWEVLSNPSWYKSNTYRIKPEEFIFNWESIDPKWISLARDGNTWNMCTGPIEFRLSYWVSVNASDDWVEMPTEIGNSVFNLGTLDHLKDSETLILRNP